ncbi:MAG: hypothetical protein A3D44_03240 [Candidatus Staskawiczbacteria bacterium RIFCSPHIGHO2_02_FULL_42_22]|uniref:Single-stranded-DNA-specific exonuclease RecJ n=1 Tax=Candidatus Staskawiczbacteria bacterium RIFCSPHIGHO2_02_FULL_42_22 TaxID=1802207 RepID=A0A1G2I5I9_9BACT|nr:MAG: hypothetical protein A3D44_03240 [Candidatus Staskawiczbacteria bacterium RIFCSPHIGHO2_02_FULL_42_22]
MSIVKNKIKNLENVAGRIKKAVYDNGRIIIYGDSDMDGIASSVILQEAIKNLGGGVGMVLFPNREEDGYGINFRAIEYVRDKAPAFAKGFGPLRHSSSEASEARPALFITLDLGITNIKEVDALNALGFSVIIIDHHQILNGLPAAEIIIDPKQEGDDSNSTHLANVGITFLLAQELLGGQMSMQLKNSFLELTALATISDMVPQIEENKMFIEEGLRSLKNTFRPGLRAFLDILGEGTVLSDGLYKVISALNAAESIDFKNESYQLLTTASATEARDLAEKLIGKTNYKQQKIKEAVDEVERRISQNPDASIIFEGDPAWKLTLAGPIASIIAQKYQKPTFIFKKGDSESCGSVRSLVEGEDSVQAMKTCADILVTYGGHAKASGFRIKNGNLERFKKALSEHFKNINSR